MSKEEDSQRGKLRFDRTISNAKVTDLWNMWTTREGLEAWWGPEGFDSVVRKLEVRPGGEFEIAMTAKGEAQVNALKGMGMELTSLAHGTFTDVEPPELLKYKTLADFIPGVAPYEVEAKVELYQDGPNKVRMVVTEDAMHNQQWTEMSSMGMNSQIDKLARIFEK